MRNNVPICLNQLDNVALEIENVIIRLKACAIRRILECKRLSGFIIDEIKDCCQGVIRFNCLSCDFAVQGQILMRDSLRSGDVHPLRRDGFIFSRSVCLDRFALAAGHNFARRGRLRWDDNAAVVLQRNKDQREQEFCLVQGVTSFLQAVEPTR